MLHTVTLMSHCCSYAMYHTSVTTAPRNVFFLRSCPLFWIWLGCSPTCLVNIWKNCNNCVPHKKNVTIVYSMVQGQALKGSCSWLVKKPGYVVMPGQKRLSLLAGYPHQGCIYRAVPSHFWCIYNFQYTFSLLTLLCAQGKKNSGQYQTNYHNITFSAR